MMGNPTGGTGAQPKVEFSRAAFLATVVDSENPHACGVQWGDIQRKVILSDGDGIFEDQDLQEPALSLTYAIDAYLRSVIDWCSSIILTADPVMSERVYGYICLADEILCREAGINTFFVRMVSCSRLVSYNYSSISIATCDSYGPLMGRSNLNIYLAGDVGQELWWSCLPIVARKGRMRIAGQCPV